ncbi:hypothetical protein HGRIS_013542 [Hohenbuehelia grisea]|uniref:Rhamnogalacturonase A/B/Epimerase-like pectate lyase domain-containing protein n=1 Tax=Hohenbuehelia grisea TaxID=104357 RepID=A0ABR3IVS3_9AGAR
MPIPEKVLYWKSKIPFMSKRVSSRPYLAITMFILSFGLFAWFLHLRLAFAADIYATPQTDIYATSDQTDIYATERTPEPFWLEVIKHQGRAPFHSNKTYPVFRNVKDYGARGDGKTDDTAAINRAISSGGRCGGGNCGSSTVSPAVVYFPRGTYVVTSPINTYYYTQLIGDAKHPPTLLAAASFVGMAVIDANPYIPGGAGRQWFTNQSNFFRTVRNFIIDLRRTLPTTTSTGIHWQLAQATSLLNIVFEMSRAPGNAHRGIWMENGSGGYMGDMIMNGGKYGISGGNQQFTVRNVTFNNVDTAVQGAWNWGWTWQGVNINDCKVGFDLVTGGSTQAQQGVGAEAIIDAVVINTPIFIRTSAASGGRLRGSIVLNNIQLRNVGRAVGVNGGAEVLAGGTRAIASWAQGNVYSGSTTTGRFVQSSVQNAYKPAVLLDSNGRMFGRQQPQYEGLSVKDFISVRDYGAKGDGTTDDTTALQRALDAVYLSMIDISAQLTSSFVRLQIVKSYLWTLECTLSHERWTFLLEAESWARPGQLLLDEARHSRT